MVDMTHYIKGCIFNLDGVLVDTSKYHYQAWRRLANQMGFDLSPEQNEALKGLSRMASLEQILEWGGVYLSEAEKMHWADVKNNWYLSLISNIRPGEVLDGVLFFLRQVRESGMRIALSSASQSAKAVLRSTQMETFFDVILDGHVVKKSKPDPQCFLLAAQMLDLLPEECLVFEDTALGVEAALSGGFTVVGIGKDDLLSRAHLVISGFENANFDAMRMHLSERVASLRF